VSNPAHAVGRRDPLRPRQVVHEERVRRQDRQGHQTGGRRMGRVVQVMNIVIVKVYENRQLRLGMFGNVTAVFSQFKWQDATANNLNLQKC